MTDPRMYPPGSAVSPSGLVRMGPSGRRVRIDHVARSRVDRVCTWCGKQCTPPRRSWCSEECVAAMQACDSSVIRSRVLLRDRVPLARVWTTTHDHFRLSWAHTCRLCREETDEPEVDHIVPIVEGGHPFDLANLRVLCPACHRRETAELARRRAERRRESEAEASPQLQLGGIA